MHNTVLFQFPEYQFSYCFSEDDESPGVLTFCAYDYTGNLVDMDYVKELNNRFVYGWFLRQDDNKIYFIACHEIAVYLILLEKSEDSVIISKKWKLGSRRIKSKEESYLDHFFIRRLSSGNIAIYSFPDDPVYVLSHQEKLTQLPPKNFHMEIYNIPFQGKQWDLIKTNEGMDANDKSFNLDHCCDNMLNDEFYFGQMNDLLDFSCMKKILEVIPPSAAEYEKEESGILYFSLYEPDFAYSRFVRRIQEVLYNIAEDKIYYGEKEWDPIRNPIYLNLN